MQSITSKIYTQYKHKWFPKLNSIRGSYRILSFLERMAHGSLDKIKEENAESIYSKEWDNLIIIDACRYDLFKEYSEDEEIEFRYSLGSNTLDYINKTFSERECEDTVYIAGNPQFMESRFKQETGSTPEEKFYEFYDTHLRAYDVEETTVMPQKIMEEGKLASKLYPDKKLVVHFMQPHQPFIRSNLVEKGGYTLDREKKDYEGEWRLAEQGHISKEEIWEGYLDNLDFVMPYVEELVESLQGKTIITSDHGNLVGENGLYGHPRHKKAESLRKVPWISLD